MPTYVREIYIDLEELRQLGGRKQQAMTSYAHLCVREIYRFRGIRQVDGKKQQLITIYAIRVRETLMYSILWCLRWMSWSSPRSVLTIYDIMEFDGRKVFWVSISWNPRDSIQPYWKIGNSHIPLEECSALDLDMSHPFTTCLQLTQAQHMNVHTQLVCWGHV